VLFLHLSFKFSLLNLFSLWLTVHASCRPRPDGQFTTVELGSPSNVTAPLGSDVQFICCGGHKWTYEADDHVYASREIGPHPEAVGAPDKRPGGMLLLSTERTGSTPTTVYTMHDDKGRLILFINNANSKDTGHYRCHGDGARVDAFLAVSLEPQLMDGNQSIVVQKGAVHQRQVMFASDQLNKVIIYCPVTGSQKIESWLWREPILPSSEDYDKLPKGKPPSRTVTANKPGIHESGYVEIGPGLAWARIRDPLSPEAPVKLWCQFEMPSSWEHEEPIIAYYMLDWELYEPINPRVYILNTDRMDTSSMTTATGNGAWMPPLPSPKVETGRSGGGGPPPFSPIDLKNQIEQSRLTYPQQQQQQQQQQGRYSGAYPILLEHKPARLACQFRVVEDSNHNGDTETRRVPLQQVYWYRNGQPVHVPPFHVDNSHVPESGLSLLEVRAYPALFEPTTQSNASWDTVERITCAVSSQVKSKPVYKVTTNASLDVDVILVPRIINKELLSVGRRVEDAVKLTCTALANGPPEMQFEFSQGAGSASIGDSDSSTTKAGTGNKGHISEWHPIEPRYKLNIQRLPADPQNPFLQRLVLEISDKPVRMILSRPDGQPLEQAEMKLINYEMNDFLGINATYEIMISPGSGNSTIVRCEYQGRDSRMVYQETTIFEATQPTKPNISVTCVGPRAVVFNIANPHVTATSPPTERIVTQKVIFAPIDTFQNSASLGSMTVYLDSNGQPSATPTNQSNQPAATPSASSWYSRPPTSRPATIPVHGLMADTKYVFEWSSGNEFGLSAMEQFTLWTKKLEMLPAIYKVTFIKPTTGYLRFSLILDDPCPYGVGTRAELSDLVVRYRLAEEEKATGSQVGVGEWSEAEVCRLVAQTTTTTESTETSEQMRMIENGARTDDQRQEVEEEQSGIAWSGNRPLTCEFPVSDTQKNYEVQVATRNRFDRSEWFTAIYQPELAVYAASICFPTCGLPGLVPPQLSLFVVLLIFVRVLVHLDYLFT
ncbi:hypothetical protein FGIG_03619, partial [Fasciola gigantica]